jgi:hypothetical protein
MNLKDWDSERLYIFRFCASRSSAIPEMQSWDCFHFRGVFWRFVEGLFAANARVSQPRLAAKK